MLQTDLPRPILLKVELIWGLDRSYQNTTHVSRDRFTVGSGNPRAPNLLYKCYGLTEMKYEPQPCGISIEKYISSGWWRVNMSEFIDS